MVAGSDTDEKPTRPVLFDHSLGWAESPKLEDQERSALRHVQANHAARQATATPASDPKTPPQPEIVPQATQQSNVQPEAGAVASNSENIISPPNTGWGQDRHTYADLKSASPVQEQEAQPIAAAVSSHARAFLPVQDGQQTVAPVTALSLESIQSLLPQPSTGWGQDRPQDTYAELKESESSISTQEGESAEQPSPPMTARQRHEARLQAFIQGDQQDRQAAKKEVASLTGGTDAAIKEVLGQEGELGPSGPHLGGGMSD
jgi:hypothetical protein